GVATLLKPSRTRKTRPMSRIRSCTALLALASAPLALAGTPTLTELGRLIPGFSMPGHGRFAIADFDGDGRVDIVVSGVSGTALLQVFGLDAEGIVSKQSLFVPDALFARVQAVPFAGIPQLVTIATDGTVRRFAGWPLA